MPQDEPNKGEYTPAEICRMFPVSKASLIRWEGIGSLPSGEPFPPPRRDRRGARKYGEEHIRAIAKYQIAQLASVHERISESDPIEAGRIMSELAIIKAQRLHDPIGLMEIIQTRKLPLAAVLKILSETLEHDDAATLAVTNEAWDLVLRIVRTLFPQM